MNPQCPHYIPPRYYVDPRTDKGYKGSAMCDLTDKYCLVEYGNECEEYNEFLKEEEVNDICPLGRGQKLQDHSSTNIP